jgi:two-component system, chemotaxis family, protein-glutamate methylesterase/glutaminase
VYIAPPGFHMIVEGGVVRVVQGPRENLNRPAIDPLFRSAAAAYGPRVIGVILTGMMDDGTAGLMVVSASGGKAIIQDPESALFSGMPKSALDHVPDAQAAPLEQIPALLLQLIRSPLSAGKKWPSNAPFEPAKETRITELDMSEMLVGIFKAQHIHLLREGAPGHRDSASKTLTGFEKDVARHGT